MHVEIADINYVEYDLKSSLQMLECTSKPGTSYSGLHHAIELCTRFTRRQPIRDDELTLSDAWVERMAVKNLIHKEGR